MKELLDTHMEYSREVHRALTILEHRADYQQRQKNWLWAALGSLWAGDLVRLFLE